MIPRFAPALALLAVLPAGGTVIQSSVFCAAGGQQETGTESCDVFIQSPLEMLEASAGVQAGEENPTPPYVYRAFVAAGTSAFSESEFNTASSSASVSLAALFTTTGPSRSGWLDVDTYLDWDFGGSGSDRTIDITLGRYSTGGNQNRRLPFTLGEPFPFEMRIMASSAGAYGFTYTFTRVQFALYEADGVTPVTPFQVGVPEPAWLGAGGALLLIVSRLLRRRRMRSQAIS